MHKSSFFAKPSWAVVFITGAVILDQIIKYLVERYLPFQEAVPVMPFFAAYRTWNEGVAFSFLSGMSGWMIVSMRLVIVLVILWWWRTAPRDAALLHLGFAMIVAGALGNIIDRLIYGHVVDYVLFHTASWSFAVFNLADSLISIGAVIVGFSELFMSRKSDTSAN